MTRYPSKPGWWSLSAAALALLVAVLGLLASQDIGAAQPAFSPDFEVELSDYHADANADITTRLEIPKGDLQADSIVYFTPPEWWVAPPGDLPIGAYGGDLNALLTLGLIGGPCNSTLGVDFKMLVCTTDTSPTVTFDEQFSKGQGDQNLYDGCEYYPDFLNTLFPTAPIYRLWGWRNVSGVMLSMNFVIFDRGTSFPDHPSFSAAWGYPLATVLNDPTAPLAPGAITDFCSPLATEYTVFGITEDNPATAPDESGYEQRRNPHWGGIYTFRAWLRSHFDADGDSYGNPLDTCPFDFNLDEDPRDGMGPDHDGIDSACDPDPDAACWPGAPGFSGDCDADGYLNRQDNCPLLPNSSNEDADSDGIGDVCDPNPDDPDGDVIEVTLEYDVEILGPPPTKYVEIDIKPGSRSNPVNPKSRGKIRVAILSAADFGATTVDPHTVVFDGASPVRDTVRDVDRDGRSDLLLVFRVQDTNIVPGDTEACLEGQTSHGQGIQGCDSIRTVP